MILRTVIIAVLLISSGVNLYFAFSTLRKKLSAGAGAYSLLLISVAVYTCGYALELSFSGIAEIFRMVKVEYIGISTFPVFWLILAMKVSGKPAKIGLKGYAALCVIPLMTLFFVYTNDFHHLYYRSMGINPDSPFPTLIFEKGPLYFMFIGLMYLHVLIGNILFIMLYRECALPFRHQALVVVLASLIPWMSNIVFQTGIVPYNIDIGSIGLGITGPVLGAAMIRLKTFRISPVARKLVFEDMVDPVLIITRNGFLADYNNAAEKLFPALNPYTIGSRFKTLQNIPAELVECLESETFTPRMMTLRLDEKTFHYQIRQTRMYATSSRDEGTILTLTDLTRQIELQQRLEDLAARDGLTGVFNRRHFMSLAENEVHRSFRFGSEVSVIMLDLDFFKKVNDTFGHDTGDKVLSKAAECLNRNLRGFDILGRYGGEEFIVLLPETDIETAVVIAERLRVSLSKMGITREDRDIHVTASFGIAGSPPLKRHLESLITAADRALYRAKAGGRNRVEVENPIPDSEPLKQCRNG